MDKTDLSKRVCAYYIDHFDELTFARQFHFASRAFLWGIPGPFKSQLKELSPNFTQHMMPRRALEQALQTYIGKSSKLSIDAKAELRRPYFERYPDLKPSLVVLFRALFLKTVYNLDAKASVLDIFSEQKLDNLYKELSADPQSVATLSSHAINFMYLYRCFIKDEPSYDPGPIIEAAEVFYKPANKLDLQLQIYLYTHSIISASLFYSRKLPKAHLKEHQALLSKLEKLIEDNYLNIKMDNKFEFLVCARLLDRTTTLEDRINEEASKSISLRGTFIVDALNNNPSISVSLEASEHRNIIFIMSSHPFKPELASI